MAIALLCTLCQHLESPHGNSTNLHLLLPLAGIFKYVINSEGLVTDIWFQRQPSKDEIARKVSWWAPLQKASLRLASETLWS